ncbi:unnamed protein product, partial [Ectocarpus fasciculatus]
MLPQLSSSPDTPVSFSPPGACILPGPSPPPPKQYHHARSHRVRHKRHHRGGKRPISPISTINTAHAPTLMTQLMYWFCLAPTILRHQLEQQQPFDFAWMEILAAK